MAGKIKFVKRGQAPVATITTGDLAAHEWGGDTPDPLEKLRAQDLELPREVNVLYINSGADYQQGTQKSERQTSSGVSVMTIPLPVVMNDTKAKQVADVNHYNAWVGRTTYKLQLSRKWSKLEPTDVINVVYNDVTFTMRITKKDDSKVGIIVLDCVAEDSSIYTQSGLGAGVSNIPIQVVTIPVQTLGMLLDIPMLRDVDNDTGIYFAACGYRGGWGGCAVFKSNDNGSTYSQVTSTNNEAAIGYVTTVLGDFYSGNIFDESNTVTVQMIAGNLSSASELLVLNGANYAVLGNELIQFKNAELVSAGIYKLSGLLRGRKGTEWAMSNHSVGERFVLASLVTWRRILLQSTDIGLTRLFKFPTFGTTLQQASATPFTPAAIGLECYSPVEAGAGRDSLNNITITWKRRGRLNAEWRDYSDIPLGEANESYEVDIMDSTFTTVLRTLTSTIPSVSYSAANQNTDISMLSDRVYVNIYQLSDIVGRGYPLTATIEAGNVDRSSTKWRILINSVNIVGGYPDIKEIAMFTEVGGLDRCTGGTPSAEYNTGTSGNAFDDNSSTGWTGGTIAGQGIFPQWIQYEFLSAVDIVQFSIQGSVEGSRSPKSFNFQYYDGASWLNAYIATNEVSWGANENRTFTI